MGDDPLLRLARELRVEQGGRHAAVVKFGKLRLKGFIGWLFWSVVHIYFLIGVKNRFTVAFTWLWDYVTFQRGARLITEVPPPGKR